MRKSYISVEILKQIKYIFNSLRFIIKKKIRGSLLIIYNKKIYLLKKTIFLHLKLIIEVNV